MLERILEALSSFELRNSDRRDLDLFGWTLWVYTCATLASLGHKATKTCDRDFIALLKGCDDNFDESFDHVFSLLFSDSDFFGKIGDKFCFVHMWTTIAFFGLDINLFLNTSQRKGFSRVQINLQ